MSRYREKNQKLFIITDMTSNDFLTTTKKIHGKSKKLPG